MNATVRAIRNIDKELEDSVALGGQVLQFTAPDHEAGLEKLSDLHREAVAFRTKSIAERKRAVRKTVAAINAEIDRLKCEIAAAKDGAAAATATDEKIIAASRAWLAAVE